MSHATFPPATVGRPGQSRRPSACVPKGSLRHGHAPSCARCPRRLFPHGGVGGRAATEAVLPSNPRIVPPSPLRPGSPTQDPRGDLGTHVDAEAAPAFGGATCRDGRLLLPRQRPPKERGRGSLCMDFPPSLPLPANFTRGRVGSLFSRRDRGLRGVSPWPLLPCACGRRPSRPRGPGVKGRIGLLCGAVRGPRPCPATASFLWFRLRAVGCGPGGLNGQRQKRTLRKFYVGRRRDEISHRPARSCPGRALSS